MAKVAWGITGSGDKIRETLEAIKGVKDDYGDLLEVEVFLSKAGAQVAKYYKLEGELNDCFSRVWVERNANTPFLTGRLQLGEFEFLLIAPATSNTVAKIAVGIADTLLTNSAIQAVKGFTPVYIMPVDYREGNSTTILPNGRPLKLRVRKEDAENVRRLEAMEGIRPFESPDEIPGIFNRLIGPPEPS